MPEKRRPDVGLVTGASNSDAEPEGRSGSPGFSACAPG
jgi:hypothetical protein